MGKVWAIAHNTFREAVRNRILYILLIFAVVLLLFSGVLRELTVSAESAERSVRSIGLGCINIFGLLIAVFVGIGLVYNELDKKTIYTIVSKPIDRWQFILGKYFGLLLTIYVNVLIMTVFFYFALYWQTYASDTALQELLQKMQPGEQFTTANHLAFLVSGFFKSVFSALKTLFFFPDAVTKNMQVVILMTCVELAIITAFAILYSSFSTPTLSAILTVFTFVIGRGSEDIIRYAWYVKRNTGLESFADQFKYYAANFVAHISPNLQIYFSDLSFRALSDPNLSGLTVKINPLHVLYGLAYCAAVLTLAVLVFRRRNFK